LEYIKSRKATIGDRLKCTRFPNSMTGGFSTVDDPDVAVCLRPGTELEFDQDVDFGRRLTIFPLRFQYRTKPHRLARFRQINLDRLASHHDALEFPDGEIILVTSLRAGLTARVLQLPSEDRVVVGSPKMVVSKEDVAACA
jgi:hypothetical protein